MTGNGSTVGQNDDHRDHAALGAAGSALSFVITMVPWLRLLLATAEDASVTHGVSEAGRRVRVVDQPQGR
jgi:hypothetical protein